MENKIASNQKPILKAMKKIPQILAILFFSLFLLFFYSLSLFRYSAMQVFYYDLGIFANILWQLSRFKLAYIDHFALGHIPFLGDHFNPSLILVSPLFWFTNDIRILLFEQALATTLCGVCIYVIAKKLKFSDWMSISAAGSFLLFAGIENPLVTDWHPESTAGLFLLIFFYFFMFTSKRWVYITSAIIFLGFKESNAITLGGLLIWLFFIKTDKKKEIFIFLITSFVWFLTATKFLIPFISKQPYFYSNALEINPLHFFDLSQKKKLIFDSLISFGFLPLASAAGLIPIIVELAIRFLGDNTSAPFFSLNFHYNVYLGIFLILTSLYGITYVSQKLQFTYASTLLTIFLLLFSIFSARKITQSPINLAINKTFWNELSPSKKLQTILKSVPKQGNIMSQNNILPYFAARNEKLYFLSNKYETIKPQIIIFDLTKDQNTNNFWQSQVKDMEALKNKLVEDNNYKKLNSDTNLFIFIRK